MVQSKKNIMIKNTHLILWLSFVLSITFTSCHDDDLHEHDHNVKAGIKTTKITYTEFKKHTKAFNMVADVNKQQLRASSAKHNKIVKDTINGFTVDTREGLYLQYANLHSFTFPIYREEDTDLLENLVLSYQNDGSYKVKILKYNLTAQEKADLEFGQLKSIQNPIVTIPLEDFDTGLVVNGCGTYTETIYTACSSGNHSFATGNAMSCEYWNLQAGMPPQVYTVTKIKCIDAGDSGGGGPIDGGFGSGPVVGGGGGGSIGNVDLPVDFPTPDTDPREYELGISLPVLTLENSFDIRKESIFYRSLSPQIQHWTTENPNAYNQILTYLRNENWSDESETFASELLNLAVLESDVELSQKLLNLTLITKQNGYFENPFDSYYYSLINPYIEDDTEAANVQWQVYFSIQCAYARAKLSQEPGWSNLSTLEQELKIYWEAMREMIHLGLDLLGLVPAVGEIADLANGVIYTIEGDGVNAALSYSSAIPFAGWFSAGIKFAKRADGLVYTVKATNNLIDFGKYNSKKFREALGLIPGDPRQAHHLIPRQFADNIIVQKAAKSTTDQGFHMHSATNGIPIPSTNHLTGHNIYSQKIQSILNNLNQTSPNMSNNQAFNHINALNNQVRNLIQNNPNLNLGQIANLISYP